MKMTLFCGLCGVLVVTRENAAFVSGFQNPRFNVLPVSLDNLYY